MRNGEQKKKKSKFIPRDLLQRKRDLHSYSKNRISARYRLYTILNQYYIILSVH